MWVFIFFFVSVLVMSSSGSEWELPDEEELKQMWWIGAIIYVTGSIMINLGSNVIRKDHSLQEKATGKNQPPYQRPLWILGRQLLFVHFFFFH